MELISFQIREQAFSVALMVIREIRSWTQAAPLPQSPDYIRGVVNLRGAVRPIVDLGARLGLGSTEPTASRDPRHRGRLPGGRPLGDRVSQILSLPAETLQPTPDVGCQITRDYVLGLLTHDGRMLSLLSLGKIVPETEAIAA